MTNEEKQKILEAALEQSYLLLKNAYTEEGDSKDLVTLLENIGTMEWMVDRFREENHEAVAERPAPVVPERPAPVAPERQELVTPAPASPVESKYSMTDVRAALARARSKGISVSDIIHSFGVDNFTALDASQYPAIMEKLAEEEKLAAKGAV